MKAKPARGVKPACCPAHRPPRMKPTLLLPALPLLLALLPACERVPDKPQDYREEPKIVTRSTTTLIHARQTSPWFGLTHLPVVTNDGRTGL